MQRQFTPTEANKALFEKIKTLCADAIETKEVSYFEVLVVLSQCAGSNMFAALVMDETETVDNLKAVVNAVMNIGINVTAQNANEQI